LVTLRGRFFVRPQSTPDLFVRADLNKIYPVFEKKGYGRLTVTL
jgi:hypothetical protein